MTYDNFFTPDDAKKELLCPLARTFGSEKLTANCRGTECALWRWQAAMADDDIFKSAIAREVALLGQERKESTGKEPQKHLLHKEAVARVMRNPEGYGVKRERGYCGLGGMPT